ncbi:MAG: lipopolysaccharide heptosyltransferase II [Candidatus Omnitrophica bacterium]|nr:lipopolysaccharide heptosyltransferase II [Candidatus Omnitrophota bacterium]
MKILVFTKNWLGDVLFEVPALQALRENFPGARITALAPGRCREILEAVPFLDEVREFDEREGERSLFAKLRFIAWLRREKFDRVFLFHRSFTRAFLAALGGIPERVGFATPKRRRVLTRAVETPSKPLHQVDYFLYLLKWAGLRVKFGAEYQFFYSPEHNAEALNLLHSKGLAEKPFAVFHIGANWEPKRWPATHFAVLADLITQNFSLPMVLTGSGRDEGIAEEILRNSRFSKPLSICGITSLKVLGALYQKARFVVSSDSGPLHIASGVGTPVVALFGPTCPRLTGPRGTGKKIVIQFVPEGYSIPWKGKSLPAGGWMERMTPEEVFKKIQSEELWRPRKESQSSLSR